MRILIAPDKFKGSLSAIDAARAIGAGWKAAAPESEISFAPIADGGEGFAATLCEALGGAWIETKAHDPLGRPIAARYAWIESEKLAVLDMSEASGLRLLSAAERDPFRANTFGTGELIRHAAERGAGTILVGLGGSATTDAGTGMAAALGYELYTSDGEPLPHEPGHLLSLTRIGTHKALRLPKILAACDVQNPLLGTRGTARVFAPQKGADAKTVETLEAAMENVAGVVKQDLDCDFGETPGAGAAGGLGFGLLSFCQASIRSGFDLVAEALHLEEQIASCDLIITGEGSLDSQTLEGKGPAGIAALARRHGKSVVAFAGSISGDSSIFDAACPLVDRPASLEEAMTHAGAFLQLAAWRVARLLALGKRL